MASSFTGHSAGEDPPLSRTHVPICGVGIERGHCGKEARSRACCSTVEVLWVHFGVASWPIFLICLVQQASSKVLGTFWNVPSLPESSFTFSGCLTHSASAPGNSHPASWFCCFQSFWGDIKEPGHGVGGVGVGLHLYEVR